MPKLTPDQTQKIRDAFYAHKLSYAGFARKHGFIYPTFYGWIHGENSGEKRNADHAYIAAIKKTFNWEEI